MTTMRYDNAVPTRVGRRGLLRRGALLGGAGVAAGLAVGAPARAEDSRTEVYDVAMLGETHRLIPGPEVENFDLRGSTYYVEGVLYPGNTIPVGTLFDPSAYGDRAIGRWVSTGSFIWSLDRLQPHRFSIQQHIFGLIVPDDLFPVDQISSQGTESSRTQDTLPSTRVITGGAGRYVGACGQITQYGFGLNTTTITILGRSQPAPNFRFHFTFVKHGL